jgi:hypothetical protein
MSYQLSVRPEAELDMTIARDWYDQKQAGLGSSFLTNLEQTLDLICRFPELYAE